MTMATRKKGHRVEEWIAVLIIGIIIAAICVGIYFL